MVSIPDFSKVSTLLLPRSIPSNMINGAPSVSGMFTNGFGYNYVRSFDICTHIGNPWRPNL